MDPDPLSVRLLEKISINANHPRWRILWFKKDIFKYKNKFWLLIFFIVFSLQRNMIFFISVMKVYMQKIILHCKKEERKYLFLSMQLCPGHQILSKFV